MRRILVTGANKGIGLALVEAILAQHADTFVYLGARDAGRGLVLSGVLVLLQFALFLVIGVMLFTYYQQVPAPAIGRADEILPAFVINTLPSGISGLNTTCFAPNRSESSSTMNISDR